jgi:hypothetical protein
MNAIQQMMYLMATPMSETNMKKFWDPVSVFRYNALITLAVILYKGWLKKSSATTIATSVPTTTIAFLIIVYYSYTII